MNRPVPRLRVLSVCGLAALGLATQTELQAIEWHTSPEAAISAESGFTPPCAHTPFGPLFPTLGQDDPVGCAMRLLAAGAPAPQLDDPISTPLLQVDPGILPPHRALPPESFIHPIPTDWPDDVIKLIPTTWDARIVFVPGKPGIVCALLGGLQQLAPPGDSSSFSLTDP